MQTVTSARASGVFKQQMRSQPPRLTHSHTWNNKRASSRDRFRKRVCDHKYYKHDRRPSREERRESRAARAQAEVGRIYVSGESEIARRARGAAPPHARPPTASRHRPLQIKRARNNNRAVIAVAFDLAGRRERYYASVNERVHRARRSSATAHIIYVNDVNRRAVAHSATAVGTHVVMLQHRTAATQRSSPSFFNRKVFDRGPARGTSFQQREGKSIRPLRTSERTPGRQAEILQSEMECWRKGSVRRSDPDPERSATDTRALAEVRNHRDHLTANSVATLREHM
ncbi:hypothetical protein EVAR_62971_1 [Eumeta japonica]|uniref:Uncharacterized protein n=1 Tax=Eumeta variegata TaxID=151549 RepID=A0A4C1Z9C7_EUMVA|nr:hypothetical protein EVAR_62971_1 [Eumeta japonica]